MCCLAHYYLSHDSLAIVHLNEATHSDKAGVRMSAYQSLYYLYQFAGDYKKALECHELFNDNMMQADREHRGEQMQHIKADYDLQMQKNNLEAEQKLKSLYLYLILGGLVVALAIVLLLLRQKTLSAKLKTEDLNENEWDDFVDLIDKVYSDFTKRLMEKYPTLTKSDLQICCLTKQGFSNQVISILMNLQTNSYARRKSRIKQEKMNGLEDERSFEEIINEL